MSGTHSQCPVLTSEILWDGAGFRAPPHIGIPTVSVQEMPQSQVVEWRKYVVAYGSI